MSVSLGCPTVLFQALEIVAGNGHGLSGSIMFALTRAAPVSATSWCAMRQADATCSHQTRIIYRTAVSGDGTADPGRLGTTEYRKLVVLTMAPKWRETDAVSADDESLSRVLITESGGDTDDGQKDMWLEVDDAGGRFVRRHSGVR